MATRRAELAEAATDYALEHGLIGLSLRPLAEAVGTSDRMLLYHFASKDDLVSTILRTSTSRSVTGIRALPSSADLSFAVLDLWAAVTTGDQQRCQRLYLEAAALGLFGTEPYATEVPAANAAWTSAVSDHLVGSGLARPVAPRAAAMIDATFMGLQIDEPLASVSQQERAVRDLADAVVALWARPDGQPGSA